MLVSDFSLLPELVRRVLKHKPESFESYDEHTLSLAVRFMPQMLRQMGFLDAVKLGLSFLPELWMVATGGVPKLILIAEFAEDSERAAHEAASCAKDALLELEGVRSRLTRSHAESEKYWKIRRESFALLRKNVKGLYAAPFIDDIIVDPDTYPKFLPELDALLKQYSLLYTVAGHIGNGNFHIIPLMDLSKPEVHKTITELTDKVYKLVVKYGGSISAEHNDGILRTPYLELQFGKRMVELFAETKRIFDPHGVFNPGKKVGGTLSNIEKYMLKKV